MESHDHTSSDTIRRLIDNVKFSSDNIRVVTSASRMEYARTAVACIRSVPDRPFWIVVGGVPACTFIVLSRCTQIGHIAPRDCLDGMISNNEVMDLAIARMVRVSKRTGTGTRIACAIQPLHALDWSTSQ